MSEPTLEQKAVAIRKILRSMMLDYEYANGKIGRKSWKAVAEGIYFQAKSLEDLLNNKGVLYGLLCEQAQPLESAAAVDTFPPPAKSTEVSK